MSPSNELIAAAEAAGLHVFGHPDPVLSIPTPWEIVEDDKGFLNIHHPREDDGTQTGDLVATCFQDERHAAMLRAAPEMLAALIKAQTIACAAMCNQHADQNWPHDPICNDLRGVIASAQKAAF